jgi:hypothetical protein
MIEPNKTKSFDRRMAEFKIATYQEIYHENSIK